MVVVETSATCLVVITSEQFLRSFHLDCLFFPLLWSLGKCPYMQGKHAEEKEPRGAHREKTWFVSREREIESQDYGNRNISDDIC